MEAAVQPATGEARESTLRRQVDELVSRVPRHAIRAVIDEIDNTGAANGARAQTLRDALVEQFNRLRPFKARRLFTGLFEPLLVDDPILYRGRDPLPGLIQRVDMGGIWHALARFGFARLAMEVQEQLDVLSRDRILDQVLASPDALVMRDLMRQEAAAYLASLLRNRKACEEFLIYANREALKDARERTPHLVTKAPIDTATLAFVQGVLEDNQRLLPVLDRVRRDLNDVPASGDGLHAEVDGQAALLVGFTRDVRSACPARGGEDPVLWLAPLMALNVKRRYDVVQRYVREYAGPAIGDQHPLHQCLFGHFSACCTTLTEVLRGVFGEVDVREGHVLSLSKPVRTTLDEARRRFEQSLAALSAGGLMASRFVGPRVRPMLADVTKLLTAGVLPLAVERAGAAARARHAPTPDNDDLLWLLDFVCRWGAALGSVGYASPELQSARGRIVEESGRAFIQATKADGNDEDPAARMRHVLRINRILGAVGETVTPWIGSVSQGLRRLVRHCLDDESAMTDESRFVVDGFIAVVRTELGRSRHWQCADLVEILRLYESRMS